MPITNEVKKMQEQGIHDSEIVQSLKEQGYNPLEINQALEQSKIKSAVYNENESIGSPDPEAADYQEMQPSLMSQEQAPEYQPTQDYQAPAEYEQYQPEQYQSYQPQSTDLVSEIAEQIVSEKTERIKIELENLKELKASTEKKVKDISDRLARIESIIDNLQATILGKVGVHIKDIGDIKKEMAMMQSTFSSALNPLVSTLEEKSRNQPKKQEQKPQEKEKEQKRHYIQ